MLRQREDPVIGDLNARTAGKQPSNTLQAQFPRKTADDVTAGNTSDIMTLLRALGMIIANGTSKLADSWKHTFFRGHIATTIDYLCIKPQDMHWVRGF